jgi:phosphate butyryltransferase
MIKNLDELVQTVKSRPKNTIAIAAAEDPVILSTVFEAERMGLADFILVGDKKEIEIAAKSIDINIAFEIIDEPDHARAAEKAVQLVKEKTAGVIMKGLLHTGVFFKAVLNKEAGLNTGRLFSQISVFDKIDGDGLQLLTDCAMVITPTLDQKRQIIENAVDLAIKLGYSKPRVAILSALETVNPQMPDTVEAAVLSQMAARGQIKNAWVDGPFALDNAISVESARHKGITGEVAGRADILLAPNLQVANVLTKSLTYFAKKRVAATVMGAKVPIVSTSRSAPIADKVLSIALANYIS